MALGALTVTDKLFKDIISKDDLTMGSSESSEYPKSVSTAVIENGKVITKKPKKTDGDSPTPALSNLELSITYDQLKKLERIFKSLSTEGDSRLTLEQFKIAMKQGMGYPLQDDHLEVVFMKVDTTCESMVDWSKYLSYILNTFQERDTMIQATTQKPLPTMASVIYDTRLENVWQDTIIRLRYQRNVVKETNNIYKFHENSLNGRYITMSRDGIINFWNIEFNHLKTHKMPIPNYSNKHLVLWITDFACVPNLNMLAISTTSGNITFYDLTAYSMTEVLIITKLDVCATCLDYWVDPDCPSRAKLLWGDVRGNICCVIFDNCPTMCFLQPRLNRNFKQKVEFSELLRQSICGVQAYMFTNIHEELVIEIKYFHALNESFLSCCRGYRTSLFMGDCRGVRGSYFSVKNGVQAFDYSQKHNIIVTCGKDSLIRTWKPVVKGSPILVLQGSVQSLLHVFIHEEKEYIISVSQDRDIHIFDMNTQICIQTIFKKYSPIGPREVTSAIFHKEKQALYLTNNRIAIFEKGTEEKFSRQLMSHMNPVVHMIYSQLFHQIISCGSDALIVVWNASTGVRQIQFTAHNMLLLSELRTDIEVTAMTLDPSQRRLITASTDNFIRTWNYNNGQMLRAIEVADKKVIVGIVCPKQRIMTAGWSKRLSIYYDNAKDNSKSVFLMPQEHNEDISAFVYKNPVAVSGSSDGDIFVWSLETGHVSLRLNAHISAKPIDSMYYTHLRFVRNFGKSKARKALLKKTEITKEQEIVNANRTRIQEVINLDSDDYDVDIPSGVDVPEFMSFNTNRPSIAGTIPQYRLPDGTVEDLESSVSVSHLRKDSKCKKSYGSLATVREILTPATVSGTGNRNQSNSANQNQKLLTKRNQNRPKTSNYKNLLNRNENNPAYQHQTRPKTANFSNLANRKRNNLLSLYEPRPKTFNYGNSLNQKRLFTANQSWLKSVNYNNSANQNRTDTENLKRTRPKTANVIEKQKQISSTCKNKTRPKTANYNNSTNKFQADSSVENDEDSSGKSLLEAVGNVGKLQKLFMFGAPKIAEVKDTTEEKSKDSGKDLKTPSEFKITKEHIKYDHYVKVNESCIIQLLFLLARKSDDQTATLVSASTGGWLRFWSMEHTSGLLGQFNGAHKSRQSVTAICVDDVNSMLFTGDGNGYIKTWDISNYCLSASQKNSEKTVRPEQFPLHQCKGLMHQTLHDQSRFRPPPITSNIPVTWRAPPILNSFRGHALEITDIIYIDAKENIVTSSVDSSVRLWTLHGQFVGIFDQNVPWKSNAMVTLNDDFESHDQQQAKFSFNQDPGRKSYIPIDIQKIASATTLRVFYDKIPPRWRILLYVVRFCVHLLRSVRGYEIYDVETDKEQELASTNFQTEQNEAKKKVLAERELTKKKVKPEHDVAKKSIHSQQNIDSRPKSAVVKNLQNLEKNNQGLNIATKSSQPALKSILSQHHDNREGVSSHHVHIVTSQNSFNEAQEESCYFQITDDLSLEEVNAEIKRMETNDSKKSRILGSNFRSPLHYKPVPKFKNMRVFNGKMDIYSALPCIEMKPVIINVIPPQKRFITTVEKVKSEKQEKHKQPSDKFKSNAVIYSSGKIIAESLRSARIKDAPEVLGIARKMTTNKKKKLISIA